MVLVGLLVVGSVTAGSLLDHHVYLPYLTVPLPPTPTPEPAGAWNGHENPTPAFNNAERTGNARWVYCAEEGQVCDIDDSYLIAYGDYSAIGNTPLKIFNYAWIVPGSNGVDCNDSTLGNPFVEQDFAAYDVTKACWLYAPADTPIAPPSNDSNWTFCGIDKENCIFGDNANVVMEVSYGTAGNHNSLGGQSMATLDALANTLRDSGTIQNGATCQNEIFEVEASKGLCWVRPLMPTQ